MGQEGKRLIFSATSADKENKLVGFPEELKKNREKGGSSRNLRRGALGREKAGPGGGRE